MSQKAFVAGDLKKWWRWDSVSVDWIWTLSLLIAALVLFEVNLGGLALRDWDEGTVAQVARNIVRSSADSLGWLYPTLGDEPYLNKPPLMHWLMAIAYSIGGISEWTSRLPGATLTACSVPMLYWLGREAFHRRTPAVFAALVYLTSLPVVRQGRLAMLDGAILCFTLVMMWCLLRSRRDSRYALGIGIGLGLICLTKGIMLGLLLGAIGFLFLLWDTPRLLTSPYLWLGVLLGNLPVGLWYGVQWMHYGQDFLSNNLGKQSFNRIWLTVEDNTGPPWYYLLELLKYGFPWLLFLPLGVKRAWENRTLGWAKLALVWSGVYLIAISLMVTKLPWYVLPIYPALALIYGAELTALWKQGRWESIRQIDFAPYRQIWALVFSVLGLVSGVGCYYFTSLSSPVDPDIALILAAVALTMLTAAVLVTQDNPQFISILLWGTYVALLLLMLSNHWVWELAEAYPVKPVSQMVQQQVPEGQKVLTSYPYGRPSLDFYSDRQIIPASPTRLERRWQKNPSPYFLLDDKALQALPLSGKHILGKTQNWTLITKDEG